MKIPEAECHLCRNLPPRDLPTLLPAAWVAGDFMGSTPRTWSTPSTASPPSTGLAKRMEDFKDTPPPAPLPSIRLKSHGPRVDTPMPAEEVADRDTMEEEGEEGLVGAEHAVTQRVDNGQRHQG